MRSKLLQTLLLVLLFLLATGCTSSDKYDMEFDVVPWSDGEIARYDALRRDGSMMGTAVWSWQANETGWRQTYEMHIDGSDITGWVDLDENQVPLQSQRVGDIQLDTVYRAGEAHVTSPSNGEDTKVVLPEMVVDNDSSMQQLRAIPFAENYQAAYANFVPSTAVLANVKVTVSGMETVEVPAGTFEAWHVVISFDSGKHDVWYGLDKPHLLIKYINNTSGSEFQLRSWQEYSGAVLQGNTQQPETPLPEDENYLPAMNKPFLATSFLIQYPLMLFFPLLLGWWLKRRFGVSWALFGYGAMIFVASQVVHLPLNSFLANLGLGQLSLPLIALVAGLSAGICEELTRWVALRFLIKNERGWKPSLQLGAGHGAAEAIIFGLLALSSVVNLLVVQTTGLAEMGLTGQAAASMKASLADLWSNPWYVPMLAGFERLFAIICHIAMTVLVMRSFTRRNISWLGAAIAFHTVLDFWAVWAGAKFNLLWVEVGVAVVAAAGLWLILRLREDDEPSQTVQISEDDEPGMLAGT